MKVQTRILVVLVAVTMTVIILAYFALRNDAKAEMLVVWGSQGSDSTCFLEIINPSTQTARHITTDVELCGYDTAIIGEQKKLVHVQYEPAQVTLLGVTEGGSVEVEQTLQINNSIRLRRFVPFWDEQGNVYFTGDLEGHEQIYQMNVESGRAVQLFTTDDTDAAWILSVSPDSRMVAYILYEGFKNVGLCQLGCYPYFHLYDMEDGVSLSMADAVRAEIDNDNLTHCNDAWSPTGQFFAFQVGCPPQAKEAHTVIYDVEDRSVVKIIPPPNEYGALLQGWLSDTEIIYGTFWMPEGMTRYFIYDIPTGITRELLQLPAVIGGTSIISLRDIDWTPEGNRFTATAVSELIDDFQFPLIVADVDVNDEIVLFENGRKNFEPLWSPSEKWIAFNSEDEELGILYVTIVDESGTEVIDVEIENGNLLTGGYDWLSP